MKTLYISDLGGTLLNKDAELSEYTVEHLNRMYSKKKLMMTVYSRVRQRWQILIDSS